MIKKFYSVVFTAVFLFSIAAKSQTYQYYYGNIHAHSAYSDGNKDAANTLYSTPGDNYNFAKQSYNFNFLGISEHNHSQAGLQLADYAKGLSSADTANRDGQFVCMYGMEYGVINNGGHVIVYGIDSLIGWETGNYKIFNSQYNYATLWRTLAAHPTSFATFAHPGSTDYANIASSVYSDTADMAVVGSAVRSGGAFSTTTNYSDGAPGTSYLSFWRKLLAAGYKLGPTIDHDNHYTTFGRTSQSRTVVLSQQLNRDSIMAAYRAMRFYASDDWNTQVSFTIDASPMGSVLTTSTDPTIDVSITDPDASDAISSIQVYYGVPGSNALSTVLTSKTNSKTLSFIHQIAPGARYYYYLEITQADGNKIWTSPIWVTKSFGALPIEFIKLRGLQKRETIELSASVFNKNLARVELEKSFTGNDFTTISQVTNADVLVAGSLIFTDQQPVGGYQYYRLKCFDKSGAISYSPVETVLFIDNRIVFEKAYPNPFENNINLVISCVKQGKLLVNIFNAEGRLSKSFDKNIFAGRNVITESLQNLPPGTYFIVAQMDDVKKQLTIVKK
ncbi:MAG: CehA/McbA family metallohydrolase [Chitinophagaceae bacterium]|nr:CehA/McbA family metallohydrolase [Chitinophagaceae bacterium]